MWECIDAANNSTDQSAYGVRLAFLCFLLFQCFGVYLTPTHWWRQSVFDRQHPGWAFSPPDVHPYVKQESPQATKGHTRGKRKRTPEHELYPAPLGSSTLAHQQVPSGSQMGHPKRPESPTSPQQHRTRRIKTKRQPRVEPKKPTEEGGRGSDAARSIGHLLLGRFSHRQRAIYGLAQ